MPTQFFLMYLAMIGLLAIAVLAMPSALAWM
jgi:hypothetical protein